MKIKQRTISLLFGLILLVTINRVSSAQIDSVAIVLLDSMSDAITVLESCSFTLNTEYDIFNDRLGLVKQSDEANVNLKAPDKFYVKRTGDKGNKRLYYDGKILTYYSEDNNQYAVSPAPSTIIETIDSIQNHFGVEFPASDIFYPDFVDSVLSLSINLEYLGLTSVDNRISHHVAGTTADFSYQLWIAADGTALPVKMAIVYTSRPGSPQYEALFKNWTLNPVLQDSMFEFIVPDGATKVKFAKNN